MKQINYSGSSKLISRIVHLLNRKAPLPLDGDGDPSWGTNGQVLATDGTGATYWSAGGGSGDVTDVKVNGTSVVDANKVANVSVPTKVSDLTNDTGFITNTVNNLTNYYLSSNTYTKTEVDSLISAIVTLNILVVQSLPVSDISTTTIYLVPKSTPDTQDVYDEYINLDGTSSGWEHIGSTQIDLSNYYTKTEINALLSAKANTADLATVATSGSYTDLNNTPTIPAAQVQSDWNQSDSTAVDYIKNKPTIPSGGDTVSWTQVQQSGTKIAEIDINGSTQGVYAPNGGSTYTEGDGIDITNNEISVDTAFTEASTRANIASGDTLATIWGKIKKFFSDLKTVAFTGSYNDLTDKPSVPGGENYVLKAGDTMTGALTIQNVGDAIEINRANSSTYSGWLTFKNSSGVIGQYSVDQNGRPRYIANNDSSDIKQIALTSDIPDISTKVSKSGDTMSGTLNMATINGVAVNFRSNSNNYDTTISYQTAGNEACVFATKQAITSWIFINGEDSITNHANTRWQSLVPGLQVKNNCVAIGKLIANGTTPSYKLDVNGVSYTKGLIVQGRAYGSGDDEGIMVLPGSTGWAGLILGSHNARRSAFYLGGSGAPFWRYNNGTTTYDIAHPLKTGTIALTSDITSNLLLNYATPFYMPNAQGTHIRFTFTGLGAYESIHLLIFGRYSSADIMPQCNSAGTGFADVKLAHIVEDGSWNMGFSYTQNNGFTLSVQVGPWSAVWGIFIHPHFPNATMTMVRET